MIRIPHDYFSLKSIFPIKQLYSCLLLLALVLTGSAHAVQAQGRSKEIVLDEQGTPARIRHEIIVRFDPLSVNAPVVDAPLKIAGPLADFITGETVEQLSIRLGQNISDVPTFKIFRNLTTLDTLSIGRDGVAVRIPPLWSAFVLVLPEWLDEQVVCDKFNLATGLVEYAHLNSIPHPANTYPGRPKTYDPNYIGAQASFHATTNYPESLTTAGRIHSNVEQAWQYVPFGVGTIKVGVIDSGIDGGHPDFGDGTLAGSRVRGGWDYVNQQPFTLSSDTYFDGPGSSGRVYWGHGTQCAGIIGALRNNRDAAGNYIGVAGIASGVSLYSLRIFGNDRTNTVGLDQVAAAILDAALNTGRTRNFGVQVLNMSWTITASPSPPYANLLEEAVKAAYYNKVVMVGARGNAGNNLDQYPTYIPEVISVSATGVDGLFKKDTNGELGNSDDRYTSSYGGGVGGVGGVDIAAPGTQALVYTTGTRYRSGSFGPAGVYETFNGTSASAPHVSGAAALLLSFHSTKPNPQTLCPEDVEQILKRTALPKPPNLPAATSADLYGAGLLDVGKALISTFNGAYLNQLAGTDASAQRFFEAGGNGATVTIGLGQRFGTLAPTFYTGEVIRSVVTATHNLAGLNILGAWGRSSASAPYGLNVTAPVPGYGPIYFVEQYPTVALSPSVTNSSATLTGYFYHITGTPSAPGTLDVWIPYNPNTTPGNYAYTVWTYDPTYYNGFRANGNDDLPVTAKANAYPNPSHEDAWVDFAALESGEKTMLELQSLTGQTLASWQHTAVIAGRQTAQLPLAKLPAGIYLCRVVNPAGVSVIRISKD